METGDIAIAKNDFRLAAMNAMKKQGMDVKAWAIGGYVSCVVFSFLILH